LLFRAVWYSNAAEESVFLYREKDDQLKRLDELEQSIYYDIDALEKGTKKEPISDLKNLEK
jgi:hypothetical protein